MHCKYVKHFLWALKSGHVSFSQSPLLICKIVFNFIIKKCMLVLGFIVPNVELSPMCHAQFKPGPPSELAQTASQFVNEVLQSSNLIDLKDLCIIEGKLVWVLKADITCLNLDGNVLDSALKALVSALKNTQLPTVTIKEDEDETVVAKSLQDSIEVNIEEKVKLRLGSEPVACSIAVFNDKLLVDPTDEEESFSQSVVTIVVDSKSGEICHFQKSGGVALSRETVQECTSLAKKQAKLIQSMLSKVAKNS